MEAPRQEALRYGDAFQGIGDAVSTYFNRKRLQNETELAESQVAAQSVENRLKLAQMITEFSRNRGLEIDNRLKSDMMKYTLKSAALAVTQSEENIRQTSLRTANMILEGQLLQRGIVKSDQELRNLQQTFRKIASEMAEAYSRVRVNDASVRHLNATIWGQSLDNRF